MEVQTNSLIDVINSLADKLGIVVDWTSDNVLPVINDLISRYADYKFYSTLFLGIVCLFGFLISIYFLPILWKTSLEADLKDNDLIVGNVLLCFVFIVIIIASLLYIPYAIDILVKSKTVPEALFLEYFRQVRFL